MDLKVDADEIAVLQLRRIFSLIESKPAVSSLVEIFRSKFKNETIDKIKDIFGHSMRHYITLDSFSDIYVLLRV